MQLILGDCLEKMEDIRDNSIDLVLTDPPYGITACKWDSIIPFAPMWEQINRITKKNAAILLFSSQPFTSALVMSNPKMFKYEWVWKKSKPNGWQHAANQPMKTTENICVFSQSPMGHISLLGDRRMKYTPQGVVENGTVVIKANTHGRTMGPRKNQIGKVCVSRTGFPTNVLEFPNIVGKAAVHPTQKPVQLLEYLIKTYTSEAEVVLDFTMGSGSTGEAAVNLNRDFIGIELDPNYFEIAKQKINNAIIKVKGEQICLE